MILAKSNHHEYHLIRFISGSDTMRERREVRDDAVAGMLVLRLIDTQIRFLYLDYIIVPGTPRDRGAYRDVLAVGNCLFIRSHVVSCSLTL
jgi:hypothetical protein